MTVGAVITTRGDCDTFTMTGFPVELGINNSGLGDCGTALFSNVPIPIIGDCAPLNGDCILAVEGLTAPKFKEGTLGAARATGDA